MKLHQLRGEFFRNIQSLDIECSPQINIICGNNGSGKSTLLEMIYCLSRGRSFRTYSALPMIYYGEASCLAFGKVQHGQGSTNIGFRKYKHGKTEIKTDTHEQSPSLQVLSKLLPVQLFHPESHDFLNSGPTCRRKFIDWGLFYTNPHFLELWKQYNRGLRQRNAALLQRAPLHQIAPWSEQLAALGEQLSQYRSTYVAKLIETTQSWLELLLGFSISITYYPGWAVNGVLAEVLHANVERDLKAGYTTEGAHRFDLLLRCHQFPAEKVLSRGEQKRLICALYLAQGQIFQASHHKGCIYLLDDILSELDAVYQSKVLEALMHLEAQVFVTSLDKERVQPLLPYGKCFELTNGRVI